MHSSRERIETTLASMASSENLDGKVYHAHAPKDGSVKEGDTLTIGDVGRAVVLGVGEHEEGGITWYGLQCSYEGNSASK